MAWYKEPSVSWFYVKEKQQCGPVQFDGLADLYEKGTRGGGVDDGTLLWSDRMSGWMKIKVCTSRSGQSPAPHPRRSPRHAHACVCVARAGSDSFLLSHPSSTAARAPPLSPLPCPLWSRIFQSCTRCCRARSGAERSRRGRRPV